MKILLSPLDWGLGHATRLMPVVRAFLAHGADVHIAASGQGMELLKKNFKSDGITFHQLTDMNVTYSTGERFFLTALGLQIPGLVRKKNRDQRIIRQLQQKHQFDIIISDNRYGVMAKNAYNIFITHQVQILSGLSGIYDKITLRLHRYLYKKYDELWIMDHPSRELAIAPRLSRPVSMSHRNAHYIGHLSQFEKQAHEPSSERRGAEKGHILVLLSGPEPSRSALFEKIADQAIRIPAYEFTIVAGSDNIPKRRYPQNIHVTGLVAIDELPHHIRKAEVVVCRSGYSTIMDLMVYRKKALLIPTPGQTEQEYIAGELDKRSILCSVKQPDLNLAEDIEKARSYQGFSDMYYNDVNNTFHLRLEEVIRYIKKQSGH